MEIVNDKYQKNDVTEYEYLQLCSFVNSEVRDLESYFSDWDHKVLDKNEVDHSNEGSDVLGFHTSLDYDYYSTDCCESYMS